MSKLDFSIIKAKAHKAIQDDMLKKAKNMFPELTNIDVIFNADQKTFTFKGLTNEQVQLLLRS